MGRLSTHVLDVMHGVPAPGVKIDLWRREGDSRNLIASTTTNADGRTDEPLLDTMTFEAGCYEIEFAIGAYFSSKTTELADPPFLDIVVIRVSLAEGQNYHVPLLTSPWSYSTYRGS